MFRETVQGSFKNTTLITFSSTEEIERSLKYNPSLFKCNSYKLVEQGHIHSKCQHAREQNSTKSRRGIKLLPKEEELRNHLPLPWISIMTNDESDELEFIDSTIKDKYLLNDSFLNSSENNRSVLAMNPFKGVETQ